MATQKEFDPYHAWLGIPPSEQPPDLYRLLGLRKFESDPAVIENAADRQMLFLRQMQSGPRQAYAEALLSSVARARLELLDPGRQAAYNGFLGQLESAQTKPSSSPPSYPVAGDWPSAADVAPVPPIPSVLLAVPLPTHNPLLPSPTFQDQTTPTVPDSPARPPSRRNRPSGRGELIRWGGIILGGPLGLALGGWIARVYLGVDFFGPLTSPTMPPTVQAPKAEQKSPADPPPSRRPPTPEPPRIPNQPRPKRPQSPAPPEIDPVLPSGLPSPKIEPLPAAPLAIDFNAFPQGVDLPPVLQTESPVTLFSIGGDTSLLEWTLHCDAADLPKGSSLFCQRTSDDGNDWDFFYAPDIEELAEGSVPIAKLQVEGDALKFQWTKAVSVEGLSGQLCNCLLEAKHGDQTRLVQLRRTSAIAPLKVSLKEKDSVLAFEIANPPRSATIFLEIPVALVGGVFEDGLSSANLNKPVVMQFAELSGAELSLRLQRKGETDQFSFRASPEFAEGPRLKFELTRGKLADMTKRWREMGQKASLSIKQSQAKISALEKQLADLQGVSGNLTVNAERDRQVIGVQQRLGTEIHRLPTHRKRLFEAEARLKGVPAVLKFLDAHDQAAIQFRVFAQTGSTRIVLAESR